MRISPKNRQQLKKKEELIKWDDEDEDDEDDEDDELIIEPEPIKKTAHDWFLLRKKEEKKTDVEKEEEEEKTDIEKSVEKKEEKTDKEKEEEEKFIKSIESKKPEKIKRVIKSLKNSSSLVTITALVLIGLILNYFRSSTPDSKDNFQTTLNLEMQNNKTHVKEELQNYQTLQSNLKSSDTLKIDLPQLPELPKLLTCPLEPAFYNDYNCIDFTSPLVKIEIQKTLDSITNKNVSKDENVMKNIEQQTKIIEAEIQTNSTIVDVVEKAQNETEILNKIVDVVEKIDKSVALLINNSEVKDVEVVKKDDKVKDVEVVKDFLNYSKKTEAYKQYLRQLIFQLSITPSINPEALIKLISSSNVLSMMDKIYFNDQIIRTTTNPSLTDLAQEAQKPLLTLLKITNNIIDQVKEIYPIKVAIQETVKIIDFYTKDLPFVFIPMAYEFHVFLCFAPLKTVESGKKTVNFFMTINFSKFGYDMVQMLKTAGLRKLEQLQTNKFIEEVVDFYTSTSQKIYLPTKPAITPITTDELQQIKNNLINNLDNIKKGKTEEDQKIVTFFQNFILIRFNALIQLTDDQIKEVTTVSRNENKSLQLNESLMKEIIPLLQFFGTIFNYQLDSLENKNIELESPSLSELNKLNTTLLTNLVNILNEMDNSGKIGNDEKDKITQLIYQHGTNNLQSVYTNINKLALPYSLDLGEYLKNTPLSEKNYDNLQEILINLARDNNIKINDLQDNKIIKSVMKNVDEERLKYWMNNVKNEEILNLQKLETVATEDWWNFFSKIFIGGKNEDGLMNKRSNKLKRSIKLKKSKKNKSKNVSKIKNKKSPLTKKNKKSIKKKKSPRHVYIV